MPPADPPPPVPSSEPEPSKPADPPEDAERQKEFPCEGCGAALTFSIGAQSLKCPYCGFVKALSFDDKQAVSEQDLESALERFAAERAPTKPAGREIKCPTCGGVTQFDESVVTDHCAFCGVPLQAEDVQDSPDRVPVDGVLPFRVDRKKARSNLREWVKSRWFAPSNFKKAGVQGRFNGIYLPFWTFDAMTATRYTGMRGEHYYVTVGSGKKKRRVRKTRWYPASGSFQQFFDDVLVCAATGMPSNRIAALEPWPLMECKPYAEELMAGFCARTYDVDLRGGFGQARQEIKDALTAEVRARIGGDEQRITSMDTRYNALTYKHLLLPVWLLTYRYSDKPYQVVVNASTGEVQGDRPYSWIKITLAALAGAAVVAAGVLLFNN